MKKTILFLVLTVAGLSASGASIDWTMNTGRNGYMTDSKQNKLTGTAYLLLTSDIADFKSENEIKSVALGGSDGSLSIENGVNKTTQTSTDDRLTAPTKYSFTILVYDSVNKEYFTSAVAYEQTAYNLTGEEYTDPKSITFSDENMYASATTRNTQEYHAVPEPSVALMGLLGLGMLLKRRRA